MIWGYAKIFFPAGRLTRDYIERYISRYSVAIDGPQDIGGELLTLEPGEDNHDLSIVFVDNPRLAMFRKASLYDGTLPVMPIYDPPLAPLELPEGREPHGYTITGYWPALFLAHIASPPPGDEADFAGVQIL